MYDLFQDQDMNQGEVILTSYAFTTYDLFHCLPLFGAVAIYQHMLNYILYVEKSYRCKHAAWQQEEQRLCLEFLKIFQCTAYNNKCMKYFCLKFQLLIRVLYSRVFLTKSYILGLGMD
jgi:hypothetical protein